MKFKTRRMLTVVFALGAAILWFIINPESYESVFTKVESTNTELSNPDSGAFLASELLEKLEVKGRAPKTGYSREKFYDGWPNIDGCSLRQRIIKREFGDSAV